MKLTINTSQLPENPHNFMRRIGYTYIRDRNTGQESFTRRLTGNFYPRFHCYIFEQGGQITFSLHLDQRPTRYEGQTAHSGEYDSSLVRDEMDRLQAAVERKAAGGQNQTLESIAKEQPKKKWWPFG